MSTITEIEQAIERLPASDIDVLAVWLEKYRAGLPSSGDNSVRPASGKPFMQFAGAVEGPADLSQRKGFSEK